jgi:hypothetical protein
MEGGKGVKKPRCALSHSSWCVHGRPTELHGIHHLHTYALPHAHTSGGLHPFALLRRQRSVCGFSPTPTSLSLGWAEGEESRTVPCTARMLLLPM